MRLPLQQRHVQVAAGAILALRDVLAPRAYEHECESPIGGGADHARALADLAVQGLRGGEWC